MPYKSAAQRRFFHSAGAKRAGISAATVREFDETSRGQKVPEHVKERKRFHKFVRNKVRSMK
jgi:hypothetical protein